MEKRKFPIRFQVSVFESQLLFHCIKWANRFSSLVFRAQKLTDNIVRKCHKCDVYFIKSNGCNKLVCRCGATQCYCCRAVDVDYNHYCNCSTSKTKNCCNKCDLFDDVKAKERRARDELLKSAKKKFETSPISDMKMSSTPKRHSKNEKKSKNIEEI